MHQQIYNTTIVHSANSIFKCFVFISEQTATFAVSYIN